MRNGRRVPGIVHGGNLSCMRWGMRISDPMSNWSGPPHLFNHKEGSQCPRGHWILTVLHALRMMGCGPVPLGPFVAQGYVGKLRKLTVLCAPKWRRGFDGTSSCYSPSFSAGILGTTWFYKMTQISQAKVYECQVRLPRFEPRTTEDVTLWKKMPNSIKGGMVSEAVDPDCLPSTAFRLTRVCCLTDTEMTEPIPN